MMKLLSMTATFGKLEKARLTCRDGLNLFYAPNEGGKSTWAAFYRAMLYGIDTRERDKKGSLSAKKRYQPWSGSPMEGELVCDWNGRTVAIRRGQRGNTPFGFFEAVYTDSGDAVPGMTPDNCGELLTGVSREVFERSAFFGCGESLAVTPAADLERRITALLTSGQEDVSFSQTQQRLKDWLNRRKLNRSVGLIPKLEEQLAKAREELSQAEACAARVNELSAVRARLEEGHKALNAEAQLHERLARKQLNTRFAQAEEEYQAALTQLTRLENEQRRFGELPSHEELKKAQGELQYLKVLDEEIKAAQTALAEAEENYIQAQIAAQNDHFPGLSGEEAQRAVAADQLHYETLLTRAQKASGRFIPLLILGLLCAAVGIGVDFYLAQQVILFGLIGLALAAVCLLFAALGKKKAKKLLAQANAIPKKYAAESMEQLSGLLSDYLTCCQNAQDCADEAKRVRGALNDLQARKENSRTDIFAFVHRFAPEVKELFGCSAALSRALNLEHERAAALDRVEQRRLRLEDLSAQGGQPCQTLELLHTPERTPEQTKQALEQAEHALRAARQELDTALGRQQVMGDTAALSARVEELEQELARRSTEHQAITVALAALERANGQLRERFSPQLNALTGEYFARLTGARYQQVSLDRELEGQVKRAGAVLPHSALYLSKGTADQLYLAVRLAVCKLCLTEYPPILLDDALVAFDDERLKSALALLTELAGERQILLFTCQKREGDCLEAM